MAQNSSSLEAGPSGDNIKTTSSPTPQPENTAFEAEEVHVKLKRRLYSSENISIWNLARVITKLGTQAECLKFAEDNGLILKQKICKVHRTPMKLELSRSKIGIFRCNKKSCTDKTRNKNKISRSIGTIFENMKIDIREVFYLIYAYAHKFSIDRAIHEDPYKEANNSSLSSATICDWYSYCREVIVVYQLGKQEATGKIGGPGKIVQIDESQFGKRKYNTGKNIEGQWVLGLIEDGSEDLRLEVCPDNVRSAEVLLSLIQKHVELGTIIRTDLWQGYDCLGEHGFIHEKINCSDPGDPLATHGANTQRILAQWGVVKRSFHRDHYKKPDDFTNVIVEYLWRRYLFKYKKDPFIDVLKAIEYVYPAK